MRRNWRIFVSGAAGILIGIAIGCQRYDFEPVNPLAISQTTDSKVVTALTSKANVMLMVDLSGSMSSPIDPNLAGCQTGSGICGSTGTPQCDPAKCPTRISELKRAMNSFLIANGTVARFGLTTFPGPNLQDLSCEANTGCFPGVRRVDIPQSNDVDAELQAAAGQINAVIQDAGVNDGTPTGATLTMLSSYSQLQDTTRPDFILLETDGVPNCNPNNPYDGCDPNTVGQCACTEDVAQACCPNGSSRPCRERRGCLDTDGPTGTLAILSKLADPGRQPRIRTFVIGFGPDATAGVLNAMAEAGGLPRGCPDGGDEPCGTGNTCDRTTGTCVTKYYKAANGDDLAKVLDDIRRLVQTDPCVNVLSDTPSDPSLLSVLINGQDVSRGSNTWTYDPFGSAQGPVVTFVGALCDRIRSSTPANPIKVEFRILRSL